MNQTIWLTVCWSFLQNSLVHTRVVSCQSNFSSSHWLIPKPISINYQKRKPAEKVNTSKKLSENYSQIIRTIESFVDLQDYDAHPFCTWSTCWMKIAGPWRTMKKYKTGVKSKQIVNSLMCHEQLNKLPWIPYFAKTSRFSMPSAFWRIPWRLASGMV